MIEIPENILAGLYRIMCNIPFSMSGYEVYEDAIEGMKKSQEWVLKYGEENNIDSWHDENKTRN